MDATTGRSRATAGTRRRAATAARVLGVTVGLVDRTSPGLRYGYVHPLARTVLRRPLPVLGAVEGAAFRPAPSDRVASAPDLRVGLLADALDVGGVGRVVEMLAEGLPSVGIAPVVVCPVEGARTVRLRSLGVEVLVAPDGASAATQLAQAHVDVIQLHSAPDHLVAAAVSTGAPLVPVLHNTEIHYSPEKWGSTAALFARSASVIAVSEIVRQFHVERVPAEAAERIVVVANGAMPMPAATAEVRARARKSLATLLDAQLDDQVVFACLARYDAQKNIAGTVASFLRSAREAGAHLVVAGDPSDWLELRRADALRRSHPDGDRVHLLGSSDAATLLAASDAFLLNSFFEGWPLAATEAVAAGLPLVISEAGGAAELVERAAPGSVLVDNASGAASAVTDARASAARRRAAHQSNAGPVAAAVVSAAASVRSHRPATPTPDYSFGAMVDGHSAVARTAAERRRGVAAIG